MTGRERVDRWIAEQGWSPFAFQTEAWTRFAAGESGLVHSSTGSGKTLAAWLGPVMDALDRPHEDGLQVLWITPLRALAADTSQALQASAEALGLPWRVESRTGDTAASVRARQRKRLPQAMVTTPESLSILLANPDSEELFSRLRAVVVDEWHELLSTKRGTQTELGLARLRTLCPDAPMWGLSATLGNLDGALKALVGTERTGCLVRGAAGKRIVIDTLIPERIERFPWAGHFGTRMVGPVCEAIAEGGTALIFCNTRAQAEIWFDLILQNKPKWANLIGLHHGSLSREERDRVELGLKTGTLKAVVATSSLDLGVDFHPVDRVLQIGSPKGVARLLQRAGRSGHRPGLPSRVTCVPTNAFELIEITASRVAAEAGKLEARDVLPRPLDVLAQHLVTVASGPGFLPDELLREVKTTVAYHDLDAAEWAWALDFVVRGGDSLRAYPEYRRVLPDDAGVFRAADAEGAKRHRMSIGTITSDASLSVRFVKGGVIGTVEESFAARLRPGDTFLFGGRPLEFIRMKDMTAWVKRGSGKAGLVPRWGGGRLPLSSELATALRSELSFAADGELRSEEMQSLAPVLAVQARWSAIPHRDEILVERLRDREGDHVFVYPIEGRSVHEGLAALFALRISRQTSITLSFACNDFGFELLSPDPIPWDEALEDGLLSEYGLEEDVMASLNSAELARRQFREIARVSGLVFQGYPGMNKSAKQLQATSGLFYDVFARYDPENLLLHQARREVLERQLDQSRMTAALHRMRTCAMLEKFIKRPTPLAFPILVDRLRETVTSESLADRVAKLTVVLEREADE